MNNIDAHILNDMRIEFINLKQYDKADNIRQVLINDKFTIKGKEIERDFSVIDWYSNELKQANWKIAELTVKIINMNK